MPYIKQEDRLKYDKQIDSLVEELSKCDKQNIKGHHNYIMFTLALKLLKHLGKRYATLQDIMGTFESCKLEFYRRIVGPHEDHAVWKNGDVKEIDEL